MENLSYPWHKTAVSVDEDHAGNSALQSTAMLSKHNLRLDKFSLSMQLWKISAPVTPSPALLLTWWGAKHASAKNQEG